MMNSINSTVFDHLSNPLVIVLSGPSGVGKDAILNRIKEKKYPYEFVTTVTTRLKRINEKHQVDYKFISVEKFQELRNNGGLLEYAQVYGNWYGVPKEPVKEALLKGKDTVIKVDVQGAATLKRMMPEALFIFISPPTLAELSKRLIQRCSETPSDLAARLKAASDEMQQMQQFDYVVCNQRNAIDLAVEQIQAIVTAEKCRVNPRKVSL
jgi:guanylate kinase